MRVFVISLFIMLSFNNVSANQSIEEFGNEYFSEVCKRFIACADDAGVVADFGSCETHLECKSSDAVCYGGKCEKPRPLLCGEEECGSNQVCDYKAQRCTSLKEIGQSCSNFSECESRNCSDGMCAAGATVAKSGGSCEINVCPLGEWCDGKTCKPY